MLLAVLVVGAGLVFLSPAWAEEAKTSFQEENGFFVLKGWFHTSAPAKIVWDVLTDYDHIQDFVSSMKSSRVITHQDNDLVVDQRAASNFMMFSFDVNVLLRIKEMPYEKIEFVDNEKKNFKYYEGFWGIGQDPEGKGCLVSYNLKVTPNFYLPGFIAAGIFKDNASAMLGAVKKEIETREQKQYIIGSNAGLQKSLASN